MLWKEIRKRKCFLALLMTLNDLKIVNDELAKNKAIQWEWSWVTFSREHSRE